MKGYSKWKILPVPSLKWKMLPVPESPEDYTIYVWDEETEQWVLDQNKDGIPDNDESI